MKRRANDAILCLQSCLIWEVFWLVSCYHNSWWCLSAFLANNYLFFWLLSVGMCKIIAVMLCYALSQVMLTLILGFISHTSPSFLTWEKRRKTKEDEGSGGGERLVYNDHTPRFFCFSPFRFLGIDERLSIGRHWGCKYFFFFFLIMSYS